MVHCHPRHHRWCPRSHVDADTSASASVNIEADASANIEADASASVRVGGIGSAAASTSALLDLAAVTADEAQTLRAFQTSCSIRSRLDQSARAKLIQNALGIESDDVLNYTFPKDWPTDREVRARIIGGWLQAEAQYLA